MILPPPLIHQINRPPSSPVISVVAPVFNEAEGIRTFVDAVVAELDRLPHTWEIVLVDDGSTDNTWEMLQTLHAEDSRIKILRFSRNFGHQAALTAGLKHAEGQAVIVMDSDMQHPPELIPKMVEIWQQGTHVIHTIRSYGNEVGWFKRKTSDWFYALCNLVSEIKFIPGAADFRLMDRAVVVCFNAMPEQSRFLRGMIRWLGFREASLDYVASPRTTGVSKFNFLKMFSLAADGITSFSILPLRWITASGLAVAAMSLCYTLYVLSEVLMTGITAPGWPTLIVAVLFLGGMQLTALGIVGEYVGRIYMETKRRPLFVVQDKLGFDGEMQMLTNAEKAA